MTTSETKRDGLIQRVVSWLRAGYPDGVPRGDYVALLGVLQRTLTPTEVDTVVDQLSDQAESGQALITPSLVEQQIKDVVKGPVVGDDVARVSARLAAVGWPLGSPFQEDSGASEEPADAAENLVGRIVGWLRQGYPAGVPEQDFIPLVALLRRRLSDEEVAQVGRSLLESGFVAPDRVDVGVAIAKVKADMPSEDDIERVRMFLDNEGWPVDFSS